MNPNTNRCGGMDHGDYVYIKCITSSGGDRGKRTIERNDRGEVS